MRRARPTARARLDDGDSLHHCVDESVSVAADDSIHFGRDVPREIDDLPVASRVRVATAGSARVRNDNNEVGSSLPERASDAVYDWRRIVEGVARDAGARGVLRRAASAIAFASVVLDASGEDAGFPDPFTPRRHNGLIGLKFAMQLSAVLSQRGS